MPRDTTLFPIMIRRVHFVVAAACVAVMCCACSSGIDKKKFDGLERDAQGLQTSISSGVTYEKFGELLRGFSADIKALGDTLKSNREKELLKAYSDLLTMYQDGYLLWRFSREFSKHNLVPEGRIYVGQDVEPVVTKYRLVTETHVFGPTKQAWKSISADSIQVVWYNAGQQRKRIDFLLSE